MGYDNKQNSNLDVSKESERFLNELMSNIILTELSFEQRKEYYKLIDNGLYDEAEEFVNNNIPDLKDKLLEKTKEILLKKNS